MTRHRHRLFQHRSTAQTLELVRDRRPRGFTLVELLVVIAIIGIMVGMGLPAVQASREMARRTECTSNLARLLLAVHSYQSAHEFLPAGTVAEQGPIRSEPHGLHHNWITHSLPYLDEANVFRHIDESQSVYAPANAPMRQLALAVVRCPSEPNDSALLVGVSSYAGSHHDVEAPIDIDNHGIFFLNSGLRDEDVRDGLAHTIFLGEKRIDADDLGWMSGTRATLRNAGTPINGARVAAKNVPAAAVAPNKADDAPDKESTLGAAPDGAVAETADDQESQTPAAQLPAKAMNVDPLYVGGFSSSHPLQANFAFGDGNVRLLSTSIDPTVLRQLANRADGKVVNLLDR